MRISRWLTLMVGMGLMVSALFAEYRTFTDDFGKSIEAELVDFGKSEDGNWVKIRLRGGREMKAALSFFSAGDQAYIRKWHSEAQQRKSLLAEDVRLDITVKLNRKGNANRDNHYSDDKTSRYTPEIAIENRDISQAYMGNTVRIVILAKDLRDSANSLVASASEHRVDFPAGEVVELSGTDFRLRKYESEGYSSDYKYGYEYDDYVIVIKNRDGKITHTRATSSKVLEYMDNVMRCRAGEIYDKDLASKTNLEPNSYYVGGGSPER